MKQWLAMGAVALSAFGFGFRQPYPVDDLRRLAATPQIDGVIQEEEWQFLSEAGGCRAFGQWEPGRVHWAAKAPVGTDVILSLDAGADGWLNGADNFEFRIGIRDGRPNVTVRRLAVVPQQGVVWQDGTVSPESLQYTAREVDGSLWVEASLTLPEPLAPKEGRSVGVRVDAVPVLTPPATAYELRRVAYVICALDSHVRLPDGLTWRPRLGRRLVLPGAEFVADYDLKRSGDAFVPVNWNFRGEGAAQRDFPTGSEAVVPPNRDGGFGVTVSGPVRTEAGLGWRVIRLTLLNQAGQQVILRSSVRVAPDVDVAVTLPREFTRSPRAARVRGTVQVTHNALKRTVGEVQVGVPMGWQVTSGQGRRFQMNRPNETQRIGFEFVIPAGAEGDYDVEIAVTIGDREQRVIVPIFIASPNP